MIGRSIMGQRYSLDLRARIVGHVRHQPSNSGESGSEALHVRVKEGVTLIDIGGLAPAGLPPSHSGQLFAIFTFSSAAPRPFASCWASSLAQKCMKNSRGSSSSM